MPMCPAAEPSSSAATTFIGNVLTSDPVRYARNVAVLEAEPALGHRRADHGLGGCRVARDAASSASPASPASCASRS